MALSDNLVGYWALNEASGNALDSHSTNDLTNNNSVGSATGKVGNARDFEEGSSQYFSIAPPAALQMGDIDFTIQAWVNFESIGSPRSICGQWGPNAATDSWLIYTDSATANNFFFACQGISSNVFLRASNLGTPSLATWYHVVVWHDSVNNQVGIKINNGTANTASYSGGTRVLASPDFTIGRSNTANMDGLLDEVAIWKRVLTSVEIADLYNSGSGRDYAYISGGSSITGNLSVTNANDSVSSAGTISIAATSAITNADDAVSSAATLAIAAGSSVANSDDAISSAGTLSLVAASSTTNADDGISSDAAITILADATVTNADDSISSELDLDDDIDADVNVTNADDTLSASGTLTIVGSGAITLSNDNVSSQAVLVVSASLDTSLQNDSVSFSAALSLAASLFTTNADDILESILRGSAEYLGSVAGRTITANARVRSLISASRNRTI